MHRTKYTVQLNLKFFFSRNYYFEKIKKKLSYLFWERTPPPPWDSFPGCCWRRSPRWSSPQPRGPGRRRGAKSGARCLQSSGKFKIQSHFDGFKKNEKSICLCKEQKMVSCNHKKNAINNLVSMDWTRMRKSIIPGKEQERKVALVACNTNID